MKMEKEKKKQRNKVEKESGIFWNWTFRDLNTFVRSTFFKIFKTKQILNWNIFRTGTILNQSKF
jgi:hypothetical protein